jgi:prepilin-type N-terminal cleavage/methylation domain-containing protein
VRRHLNNLTDERGFTLVELLTVMLIIAVLAGLAIPAFFSQSTKARDAEAKQGLGTARMAIELIERETGSYAGITTADLEAEERTLVNVALNEPATTIDTYTLEVVSSSGATFSVSREAEGLDFDCVPRDTGGCPLDGNWGE